MTKYWLLLAVAIACETLGSSALKASNGFSEWLPSLLVIVFFALTFYLVSKIVTRLPLGMVYAIWAGAGTALTALVSVVFFNEMLGFSQLLGIATIIVGVVILNLSTNKEGDKANP